MSEHDDIFAEEIAKAKETYGDMSREELLQWQEVWRHHYSTYGPTHKICAAVDVIREFLERR